MKIDSVITMEVKTREEELEELLAPDGKLNHDIFIALQRVIDAEKNCSAYDDENSTGYTAFDAAINTYVQYAIEYDRLKRRK